MNTKRPLLLLDFDKTLFNTAKFWDDFVHVFCQVTNQSVSSFQLVVDHFSEGSGLLQFLILYVIITLTYWN